MHALTIAFDRGTLRLTGAVDALGADIVRFDPRTGFHRAAAHRYAELLARCARLRVSVDDQVARARFPPPAMQLPFTLRPYQEQALESFEAFGRRGLVALPTGSGKTVVACAVLARAAESALVLVPTRPLLDQWASVLRPLVSGPVGIVGDGLRQVEPVTVMTFESAYRHLDRHGDRFGVLVVDEAHHFAGGVRAEALEMCAAPVRLGLTATPPDPGSAGASLLEDRIGPAVFALGVSDLIGRDLAALELVRVHVALRPDERKAYTRLLAPFLARQRELRRYVPGTDWATCLQLVARMPDGAVVLDDMRRASRLASFPAQKRAAVRTLADRHRGDRTLVFTSATDDAYALASDLLAPVITAHVGRAERERILADFRSRRVRAVVSAQVLNEGIDVPEANVAIIVAGALGGREYVQRIGRILRPADGKRAVAYELVTLGTIDEARARARRKRLVAHEDAVCSRS